MASLCNNPKGRKRIVFTDKDGNRRTIHLGKCRRKYALAVKVRVESLVAAALQNTAIDDDVSRWVGSLGDRLHRKLARADLVQPRVTLAPERETTADAEAEEDIYLAAFLDSYLKDRDDLKRNSLLVYGHTRRTLVEFFGPDKPLAEITEYDAEQWQRSLGRQGLSKATVRKRSANAKVFFNVAVRRRLIPSNPFLHIKSTSVANDERAYFISQEDTQKVLDNCPDAQWRAIFALARYGGLRTPSETLLLRWEDLSWQESRMLVRSPKTEHYEGKESRVVPIFPELRPHLLAAFEEAKPGSEYVITRYRQANTNLRTQLQRILKRAGLKPWPRLFQNLRSSRQTELAVAWPEHIVCAWMGNSKAVAIKHYLQVREEDFARAANTPTKSARQTARFGAESSRTPSHGVTMEKGNRPSSALNDDLRRSAAKVDNSQWRRRESNPHSGDATAMCSRYTTSPEILRLYSTPCRPDVKRSLSLF